MHNTQRFQTFSSRVSARAVPTALDNDSLRRLAPSIFATEPWSGMSSRYAFIPTIQIVDAMRGEGLVPFSAQQAVARVPGKAPFTKHMLRFRDTRKSVEVAGTVPEIVLINSHDGASNYSLMTGAFRFICMHGMRRNLRKNEGAPYRFGLRHHRCFF